MAYSKVDGCPLKEFLAATLGEEADTTPYLKRMKRKDNSYHKTESFFIFTPSYIEGLLRDQQINKIICII